MYFSNCKSVAEVKSLYRELAMQHHPDRGGETATMQAINAEYHDRLNGYHGTKYAGFDGKQHAYYYNQEVEQELMDKIAELLALRMDGVTVELVGVWVWIHGATKEYRKELSAAGCKWHSKRVMWYFRRFTHRRQYSGAGFDSLRAMYGSKTFEEEREDRRQRQARQIAA